MNKVESRADAFYVMDAASYNDTVQTVVTNIKSLDTNYVATYYPWIRIVDRDTNSPIWVPPSVPVSSVYSFNDKIAHPWFAPAGLNR